mmetsp:Transcript_45865/g.111126  ORF Transcript_45865/g.111126 Transcript_45865/m.111126 type:complete len:202 (+) Transcript_45865:245-850(+)
MTTLVSSIIKDYALLNDLTAAERQEWNEMLDEQKKYMKQVEDAFQTIMECHDKKIRELNKWKQAHDRLAIELQDIAREFSHLQEQWKTSPKRSTSSSDGKKKNQEDRIQSRPRRPAVSKDCQHASTPKNYPDHLLCPLTHEPFVDPVIDYEGNTYEKNAILEWLATHPTSPLTRNHLTENQLIPNRAIKHAIACWKGNGFS